MTSRVAAAGHHDARQQRRRRSDEEYAERADRAENEARSTHERLAGLDEALSRLPGSDRAILALRYEEQLGVAEIATILQIPPGTVKSRLHYARERLRTLLPEELNLFA